MRPLPALPPLRLVTLGAAAVLAASTLTGVAAAATSAPDAETWQRPADGVLALEGRGYGHGRGMSQWGAHNAARLGRTATSILDAYYPGTRLAPLPAREVRVWLSVAGEALVVPADQPGLRAAVGGTEQALPREVGGCSVDRWRVAPSGPGLSLAARACGAWTPQPLAGAEVVPGPVVVRTDAGRVRLVLGAGDGTSVREYRGAVAQLRDGSASRVVNTVAREDYLRSVVAWEMSPSWPAAALQAQAVAARTYASWDALTPSGGYDICDTERCQVYRGTSDSTVAGVRTATHEDPRVDAAVAAVADLHLLDAAGSPAFAQYSAANGGRTVAHPDPLRYPYLPERDDPWDGAFDNPGHAWRRDVPAAALERAWPAVGTVHRLAVLARSGAGEWGGRVAQVRLEGSAGAVTLTGEQLRSGLGLRSSWWWALSSASGAAAPTSPSPSLSAAPVAPAPVVGAPVRLSDRPTVRRLGSWKRTARR